MFISFSTGCGCFHSWMLDFYRFGRFTNRSTRFQCKLAAPAAVRRIVAIDDMFAFVLRMMGGVVGRTSRLFSIWAQILFNSTGDWEVHEILA